MKEIVIAGACRTAQGKLGGALRSFTNQELGSVLIRALLERS
jgi:acetyl-CoA acetyltransferase